MATTIVSFDDDLATFEDGTSVLATPAMVKALPRLLEALRSMMEIAGTLDEALQDAGLRDTVLAEYQLAHIDAVFETGHIALAHADGRKYGAVEREEDA